MLGDIMLVFVSAIIYICFTAIVVLFQFALMFGAPWGAASMGGKYPGKYPPKMRIVSLINIIIISFQALIVMIKADFLLPEYKTFSNYAIWFIVGLSVFAVVLNTITPSKIERIWAPVGLVLFISSLIVALN
jgi:hypothetical protein